jgi:hypothetical protein
VPRRRAWPQPLAVRLVAASKPPPSGAPRAGLRGCSAAVSTRPCHDRSTGSNPVIRATLAIPDLAGPASRRLWPRIAVDSRFVGLVALSKIDSPRLAWTPADVAQEVERRSEEAEAFGSPRTSALARGAAARWRAGLWPQQPWFDSTRANLAALPPFIGFTLWRPPTRALFGSSGKSVWPGAWRMPRVPGSNPGLPALPCAAERRRLALGGREGARPSLPL